MRASENAGKHRDPIQTFFGCGVNPSVRAGAPADLNDKSAKWKPQRDFTTGDGGDSVYNDIAAIRVGPAAF
jgi:hypothetical protein